MSDLFTIIALGFVLGMRHATDPDHVVAVTTIVTRLRTPGKAALVGAAWGVGHMLTVMVVGGGIILFGWVIPARVGLSMEFAVGLMLIALGLANVIGPFRRTLRDLRSAGSTSEHGTVHSHAHAHGDYVHTHSHAHAPESHPHASEATPLSRLDRRLGGLELYRWARPLVVGVVHGMAGSAAVALMVLAAIRTPAWAVLYLLVFGVGTILGMMLMTTAIALPLVRAPERFPRWSAGVRLAAGVVSLAFGLLIAYRIGVTHGLFSATPHWTPA